MTQSLNNTEKLEQHGIKPTRQRVLIADSLFHKKQHVTAEQMMLAVNQNKKLVSKATVYNTLGIFAAHGLLREVVIDPAKLVYDTNLNAHHHLYDIDSGELEDIELEEVVTKVPELHPDLIIDGVEVIIRVKRKAL